MCNARPALAYAQRLGWAVFPQRGKAPAIAGGRGYLDATTDPAIIAEWWRKYPSANIGISCIGSRFLALDVDKGGVEPSGLPATVTGFSGGGGVHLLFRVPAAIRPVHQLSPHVDIKWHGSITVAPSLHASGRRYAWDPDHHPLRHEIADAPPWLVELLSRPARAAPVPVPPVVHASCFEAAALRRACDAIAEAEPGSQERTLHCEAYSLGRKFGMKHKEPLIAAGLRMRCSRGPWTEAVVRKKVELAMQAGAGA